VTASEAVATIVISAALMLPAVAQSRQARFTQAKVENFQQLSRDANRARDENRRDDAIRLYRQCLTIRPTWDDGLWSLSDLLYQKEDYFEARDLLRRYVSVAPQAGVGWALLGISEFQTREYSRVIDHLQRARNLGFGERKDIAESVVYFSAVTLTRVEQYDNSMDLLFAFVNAGRCDTPVQEAAGLAALRMPLLPAEIPGDRREMIRLAGSGFCAVQMGQHEEAEKQFRKMTQDYTGEPGVHFLYGSFLANVRPDEGIPELRHELEISPFHVQARVRLADIYLKQQDSDQALRLAAEAVKLAPAEASPHMLYGEALVAKRDLASAIEELERAREQAPDLVRVHVDLLRAYSAAGRTDDANREKEAIERLRHPGSEH